MAKPPPHLIELTPQQRRERVLGAGLPEFRAAQLTRHWFALHDDPGQWTDIPADQRAVLAEALLPELLSEVREVTTDEGMTRKTLWRLHDGVMVESVLMAYPDRVTVCISTQAGCAMDCPFCATGQGGLQRNLSTAEIVAQVRAAAITARDGAVGGRPRRLSNVVLMGMGEPLANAAAVFPALRLLIDPVPHGLGLSARKVTVSTVGVVPRMIALADLGLPVTLAVSLHAPDDELRSTLVPLNRRYPVGEVLAAAWQYAARTGRRVSIEYALIGGVNDQAERAEHLAGLLAGRSAHVNLIPLNTTAGSVWRASPVRVQQRFCEVLRTRGIPVTVRDTRGAGIDGACGQLAGQRAPRGSGERALAGQRRADDEGVNVVGALVGEH
ncbi:MAG: 23S rRNA (adenine(2503)-C(2))-methyltransferase RlmN [Actinomycetales bacterium]|nr:23S rRNA (adenine(2503)-C(2))-methyltransferase RlmN [Actinomycetales bacterium]